MALGNIPPGWVQSPGGLFAPPYPPAVVDLLTQIQRGVYGGSGGLFGTGIPSANSMGNPSINPQFPQTDMPVRQGQRVQLLNNHRAPYGTITPNLPYAQDTPLTDEILAARQRQGNLGVRGVLRNSGPGYMAETGYPRQTALPAAAGPAGQGYATPLLTQVQQGVYGGNPSAINAGVIPEVTPSSIPPGAGRGTGAGSMPYAQWQQASDDLVSAVGRQGPYAGTRGWGRSSGPGYVAETGFPRQVALPQYAESLRIPNQTGLAGAVNEVPVTRPGSIPQGAGRGTGIGSLPFADEAIALGPVPDPPPVRQSTLRNALRNGTQNGPGMSINNAGALAESVIPETPVSIGGRRVPDWRSFQGGSNGVGAAGFPTADYVPSVAPEVAAQGGIRSALGGATSGIRGAATDAFSPRNGASSMGNIKRFGLGLGIGMGGGALADRLGGSDTVAGQFTEGFSQGGSFGSVGGLPGAIVGGLGVGIGNVASHALQGRGIESILGGGGTEIAEGPLGDYIRSQQTVDAEGNPSMTEKGQIVAGLVDPEVNVFAQMGLPEDFASEMTDRVNGQLAGTDSQAQRVEILKDAADEIYDYWNTGGETQQQQMSPNDIAAMQIMASQMMAPVAADSVALGSMQASALEGLQGTLPEAYRQPVQQMVDQAVPSSQRVANAYMQQAYAMPQLDVLQGYQNQVDQTAQQLTAQALSGAYGTGATGGGDLASLIAGATGGGGSSADIVAALAGG